MYAKHTCPPTSPSHIPDFQNGRKRSCRSQKHAKLPLCSAQHFSFTFLGLLNTWRKFSQLYNVFFFLNASEELHFFSENTRVQFLEKVNSAIRRPKQISLFLNLLFPINSCLFVLWTIVVGIHLNYFKHYLLQDLKTCLLKLKPICNMIGEWTFNSKYKSLKNGTDLFRFYCIILFI